MFDAVLHRLYGKFVAMRPFIRRLVANTFVEFVYIVGEHRGIAELLEVSKNQLKHVLLAHFTVVARSC